MRYLAFKNADGITGLAVQDPQAGYRGLLQHQAGYPGSLDTLVTLGADALEHAGHRLLKTGAAIDLAAIRYLPPLRRPSKIICVGLNYRAHTAEIGFEPQSYPAIFARFPSSLVGHQQPILRPPESAQLDYEGELVAVIGRGGRRIARAQALEHVVGYALFNDASLRDYQFKSPQWTMGKNFDATGAFGPELVSADELPPGCHGLRIQTRLNGEVVQSASTADMIVDIAALIETLSEVFTLQPGDLIVSGTPAGVGAGRTPPLWMQPGDVCEVEVEGLGILRNPIALESV
jgi:2-keto-4-pentenoate hydratase/2-oxohepta-3-ene-1,7-dioic acid hydratase in catechol pathway